MYGLMGTKVGMTQVFEKNGHLVPVTVIYVEPNQVLEIKEKAKHGYDAVKLGYYTTFESRLNKSVLGFLKKVGSTPKRYIREIRGMTGATVGSSLSIGDVFKPGEYVDIQAKNKGHGYTGAIKKWNFKIGPLSHGAGYKHRFQGSVETGRGGSQAQRVFKGKKMAGRWGNENVTVQNLAIVAIDPKANLLLVHGAVPGWTGGLVLIRATKKNVGKSKTFDLVNSVAISSPDIVTDTSVKSGDEVKQV